MNPEIATPSYTDDAESSEAVEVNNDAETKLLMPQTLSTGSSEPSNAQWHKYGEQIAGFIQALPSYVTGFFRENKGPLGVIGLIVGTLVAVRLVLALLDAIDDIPLVAPALELIGLAYTGWFVYRYLLTASSRQELSEQVGQIKEQILGTQSSDV
jgi:hypothetical protein